MGLGAGCRLILWVEMGAVKEMWHLALYGGQETERELQGKGGPTADGGERRGGLNCVPSVSSETE